MKRAPYPRKLTYPLLGFVLALGAPAGLLALKWAAAGAPALWSWAGEELAREALTYGYVTASTAIAFVVLGLVQGSIADRLHRSSRTDPLTRLSNRRHLHERLLLELDRSARYGTPLSLLLVDVDHLKLINDRYGHEAGDAALVAVASALEHQSRKTDVAARWGGDEFAVLTPGISAADAANLGERIREMLRAGLHDGAGASVPVVVSIGVTDLERAEAFHPEALYAAADAALYEAKRGGRDRTVVSSYPPAPRSSAA